MSVPGGDPAGVERSGSRKVHRSQSSARQPGWCSREPSAPGALSSSASLAGAWPRSQPPVSDFAVRRARTSWTVIRLRQRAESGRPVEFDHHRRNPVDAVSTSVCHSSVWAVLGPCGRLAGIGGQADTGRTVNRPAHPRPSPSVSTSPSANSTRGYRGGNRRQIRHSSAPGKYRIGSPSMIPV